MNRAQRRRQKKLGKKNPGPVEVGKEDLLKAQKFLKDGISFHQSGQLEKAVGLYKKIIEIQPDNAEILCNLGVALHDLGRLDEAFIVLKQAVAYQPDYSDANFNFALVLKELNKLDEVAEPLKKVISLKPDFADAHSNFHFILEKQDKRAEAVDFYNKKIANNPSCPYAHFNLGVALANLDKYTEAVSSYQNAIATKSDYLEAYIKLCNHFERVNDISMAQKYIHQAMEIAPDDPNTLYSHSVLLRRQGKIDDAIRILEKSSELKNVDRILSVKINFELGKLYDRNSDTEKAFHYFSTGNRLQSQENKSLSSNKQQFLSDIKKSRQILTSEWVQSWSTIGEHTDSKSPTFLVGFPRSGTTLIDQVLDSHLKIQVMEEKQALHEVIKSMPANHSSLLATLEPDDIKKLRDIYFQVVDHFITRDPNALFIDKLPLNIIHVPLILRLFPKSKFILAMRHPCDVVLSNYMQIYKLNNAMSNFLTLRDTVNAYEQVMGLWQQYTNLLPVEFHTVKYESLVSDFNGEVKLLLDFLHVEWDDRVLSYHQHAKQRGTISTPSYQSVTEPIYQRAKYRWVRYERQLKPFMKQLELFIEEFGYSEV
jgi:tetratricopeptide (TPR) repeat protein